MAYRTIHLLLFLLLTSMGISAQTDKTVRPNQQLFLVAKYGEEGTQLRWGFGQVDSWLTNFREEYVIYRRRVNQGATAYAAIDTVRLLPEAELEALADRAGGMTGVILSMAYQEWDNSTYTGEGDDFTQKRDNLQNRYALYHYAADRDYTAARAGGLAYTDSDLEPGVTYAYRVVSGGSPRSIGVKVVAPVVANQRPLIHRARNTPGAVVLSWEREIHDKIFSGYFIERASASGEDWQRLNELPYVQGYDGENREPPVYYTYTDSIAVGQEVRYRLVGFDAFGSESEPSPFVVIRGKDLTPPPAPILVADQLKQLHLQKELSWTQPDGEAVTSYHLQRRFDNQKEIVIDFAKPGERVKIDAVTTDGMYEYTLIAQDAAGNLAWSNTVVTRVLDREPPSPPAGLTAEVDTNGIVTLIWDAPDERDVVGYYVYARDGDRRAFRRLTNMPHNQRRYIDTLSMELMNQYRYYYVTAIDKDILYSFASDTLEIKRPDKYPPAPALISDFEVHDEAVRLSFRHSNSRDVVAHDLLRRELGQEEWQVIHSWAQPPSFYYDSTTQVGTTYLYAYRAVDDTDRYSSIVSELQVKTKRGQLGPPKLLAESRDFRVVLSWQPSEFAQAWQLYRSVDGGPEQRLVTLTKDKTTYADGRTDTGKQYRYRLRLIRSDGRRSPFSEPIEISL